MGNDAARAAKQNLWGLEARTHAGLVGGFRALAWLLDECLDLREGTSLYRVCFFRNATQDTESEQGLHLGRWIGWDFSDVIPRARFDRGKPCEDGTRRKLTVSFRCGGVVALHRLTEPNKCVYEMEALHPGACN